VLPKLYIRPVVETGSSDGLLSDRKAEWFDQVKFDLQRGASSSNGAGILRDLRFYEDNVHGQTIPEFSGSSPF
jgi:hypothetical protein